MAKLLAHVVRRGDGGAAAARGWRSPASGGDGDWRGELGRGRGGLGKTVKKEKEATGIDFIAQGGEERAGERRISRGSGAASWRVWRLGVASIPAGREGEWGGMWSRGGRGLGSTPVGTRGGAGSVEGVGDVADGWSWPEVGDDRWGLGSHLSGRERGENGRELRVAVRTPKRRPTSSRSCCRLALSKCDFLGSISNKDVWEAAVTETASAGTAVAAPARSRVTT
uniref:Retrotransposon protein, putative, Ty3-gypsy subclass n=1 Tax=Oryza sativa subsp. japonica TaxID=39947 RepID=Q2QMG5_ORYSJ|nr:retrotransposon protein, putative, Ty3-gypsy subclass [Oryza sativa Japonica Group]